MQAVWPVLDGAYVVGDPAAPVAVCVLTSDELAQPLAQLAGVAIAGQVYTANLGIERVVVNVTANPAIRFLLLCGRDSKLFLPGQSLGALVDHGLDGERGIVGAPGYDPVLPTASLAQIDMFRQQIELIDAIGEEDVETLAAQIDSLVARSPGRFSGTLDDADQLATAPRHHERFVSIRPGGQREPLQYDPNGYFVITLDRDEDQIVLRHYLPDHTPAHEMRGRAAASMLLGLVRDGLISQLSHAGYLGRELAKAETALRLELRYDQDRPLRRPPAAAAPAPPTPRVPAPLTWELLAATRDGTLVSVALAVTARPSDTEFEGVFLELVEQGAQSVFRRTEHQLAISTTSETTTVMGSPSDVVPGAIVRVQGVFHADGRVEAQRLVVLTNVARVR